jgi:DNA-binding NarL/FixJ family response regulator
MKTALIVDDRFYMRAALRGFLALHTDLEICGEAADGFDAIVQAHTRRPDLVLIDLTMPRMNGMEAAAIIKKTLPETRVVLFTLNGDLAIKGSSKTSSVDLIVSKAEGATGLTNAIQTLLAESEKSLRPIAP